jgi:hypothetical protein
MTDMETDYTELCEKINAKILEAAAAMKAANKLAKDAGVSSLTYDEYNDEYNDEEVPEKILEGVNIYPLFNELDKAGWRTSSIGC